MIARSEERERVAYEFDAFRVDPVRRLLLRDGEPLPITPKAFSILLMLLERPGEVVEKAELIERVWPGVFVTEANLTQNVFSLRKCLGERANDNRSIVPAPGQGSSFAGALRRVDRQPTTEIPILTLFPPPAAAVPVSLPVTPEPFPAYTPPVSGTPEPAPAASAPAVPSVSPSVFPSVLPSAGRWRR